MSDTNNNGGHSAESLLSELETHCESDSLSEEGLRELFERHGLTSKNDNTLISNFNYEFFLAACENERVSEGIIRLLLEYFPAAARVITDEDGITPLHFACVNKSATRGIIQLLIDAAPDSVRSVTNKGNKPLHYLCDNELVRDEIADVEMLKLLIEKNPEAIRHANNDGCLPIHIAAREKSHEFCRVLIEAYPGSERMGDSNGYLPLHHACCLNTTASVEWLYKCYPDAINYASTDGFYPIHFAIDGLPERANPKADLEVVRYLLDCDPNVVIQKYDGKSLLHNACLEPPANQDYFDSIVDTVLEAIKVIYDAHPEAIEDEGIARSIQDYHQQGQAFINTQLDYARQAKDLRLMTTPDENGQLPLHRALHDNVRLGSIKLLVKGNPSAIRNIDLNGMIPLHVACQHHDSASVVKYLVGLDATTLGVVDQERNTALHYACRGGKYETIAILLEKYNAVSVSKRNAHKKLPIDLLWESNAVEDRESVEYIGSVFRLLKAYPESVTSVGKEANTASDAGGSQSKSGKGKKRKFVHE